MTAISFYHLQHMGLEVALPKLLEKMLSQGLRGMVVLGSEERVAEMDSALWTYGQRTFLPHGTAADGASSEQPVYLTTNPGENPNRAQVLVLTDGVSTQDINRFDRVLDIFDGTDAEAVTVARGRWKSLGDAGHTLTYWQQTDAGGWKKKD